MTRRLVSLAFAVLVAAGVAWLLRYAGSEDTYYSPGDVSRWDHARKDNAYLFAVAAVGLGVASVIGLLANAVSKTTRFAAAVLVLTVLALCSLPVAYVALTLGH